MLLPRLPLLRYPMRSPTPLPSPSSSSSSSSKPPLLSFPTPESLSAWLRPRLPDSSLSSWGVLPGTKPLHNLWRELSLGETSLHEPPGDEDPPIRAVHVASVRVRNPAGAVLVESHQLLSDGTLRPRGRPLSEKMRPGESLEDAISRAVAEELEGRRATILPGTYETRVEDRTSSSYPGLPARYVLHSVDAEVDGLPEEGEFATGELGEDCGEDEKLVVVKKHFWKWVFGGEGSSVAETI